MPGHEGHGWRAGLKVVGRGLRWVERGRAGLVARQGWDELGGARLCRAPAPGPQGLPCHSAPPAPLQAQRHQVPGLLGRKGARPCHCRCRCCCCCCCHCSCCRGWRPSPPSPPPLPLLLPCAPALLPRCSLCPGALVLLSAPHGAGSCCLLLLLPLPGLLRHTAQGSREGGRGWQQQRGGGWLAGSPSSAGCAGKASSQQHLSHLAQRVSGRWRVQKGHLLSIVQVPVNDLLHLQPMGVRQKTWLRQWV